jgi:hypothetical protein
MIFFISTLNHVKRTLLVTIHVRILTVLAPKSGGSIDTELDAVQTSPIGLTDLYIYMYPHI